MGRLIVVSNRTPSPRERTQPAGGLTVGLRDAVRGVDSMWFGWSGNQVDDVKGQKVDKDTVDGVTYATIDMTPAQYEGFYQNFSNGLLWPLCHYRMGMLSFRRADWDAYLEVNRMFAEHLTPLLRPDDVIWVHDYHLFPLGQMLRDAGVMCRIGFFLHIPFPPWSVSRALPIADELLHEMTAYDLVGVQTEEDAINLDGCFAACGVQVKARAFAIGIDPDGFLEQAETAVKSHDGRTLRESLHGRKLILGVDRLDYSKGLPERMLGYAQLLKRYPEHLGKVTFLQIAPVSRGGVATYQQLRQQLEELVGRINGEYASYEWTPIRYLTSPVARTTLAGFHRIADVGLVTPLRDGMNLVAKEYVAAQDPKDPGSLVLSHFAGAAPELPDALLVNPYDADDTADALHLALTMPLPERKRRWHGMRDEVWKHTAATWARDFLEALHALPSPHDREPEHRVKHR
ncbi:alpha,alpha-trehalose-phosphate synthase (UDP-forming) [Tanticharoenia sakaeratensis]|uniref:Trehalose-6-phosphate synthase n=1 Tax=Tanticharoenia sakaeratensis NBRC 103193 TaxID=1231623 RepID=A0A0D6MM99_9PROT|nr:trehalose-6-phosphate synthase [Tanticharoenia sakaeratensis]GAN54555.1 alpha,alpha-trehalose-phosphate synthase [Tanticharoenia sakaeratensis NBRC 103193]GBQ24443.1 alpha,alpha-trehalose-phosphate synthase [Tanticharoenia sakaeratensis NBRC 103193]